MPASLAAYRKKRDFSRTPEPAGATAPRRKRALQFVVQKHDATRLHFDFRIELDGVLKSWAVTRGPSDNPKDKRLAVQVEDHPIDYGAFEGTIPKGAYGGGTVMLWDTGSWEPVGDPHDGLAKGSLRMRLLGERMHGEWSLVRMKKKARETRDNWLLIKHRDEYARDEESLVPEFLTSVTSGRAMDAIAGKKPANPRAKKKAAPAPRRKATTTPTVKSSALSDAAGEAAAARHKVRLTSPDRVVFPEQGVTKAMLVAYYDAVAERMLPYIADRPLALLRCPQGNEGSCFFQKHDTGGFPAAMKTLEIADNKGKVDEYFFVRDAAGLIAGTQMNVLEWHLWGARRDKVERPERVVFDLDPADDVPFARVRDAALQVRDVLRDVGLISFPLLTGGKGIHVVAPVTRRATWDATKTFARTVAHKLAADEPKRFIATASKAQRDGLIYIDYRRNERGASAIAPYSCRSRSGAPVALPVSWNELQRVIGADAFLLHEVVARVHESDPWDGYFALRQSPLPRSGE